MKTDSIKNATELWLDFVVKFLFSLLVAAGVFSLASIVVWFWKVLSIK